MVTITDTFDQGKIIAQKKINITDTDFPDPLRTKLFREGADLLATSLPDYISGKNLELHPNTVIVQSWRATDFPEGAEDSILKVIFEEIEAETKITINHTNIPESMVNDYKQGWLDYYFKPMKEYFK